MTTTPMRSLPHLPLIPVARALRVLQGVGMPKAVIASLTAMTRMQVHRLYNDSSIRAHVLTQNAVSELAYKALQAKRAGLLDRRLFRLGVVGWKLILEDPSLPPLADLTAEDLLTTPTAGGAKNDAD